VTATAVPTGGLDITSPPATRQRHHTSNRPPLNTCVRHLRRPARGGIPRAPTPEPLSPSAPTSDSISPSPQPSAGRTPSRAHGPPHSLTVPPRESFNPGTHSSTADSSLTRRFLDLLGASKAITCWPHSRTDVTAGQDNRATDRSCPSICPQRPGNSPVRCSNLRTLPGVELWGIRTQTSCMP